MRGVRNVADALHDSVHLAHRQTRTGHDGNEDDGCIGKQRTFIDQRVHEQFVRGFRNAVLAAGPANGQRTLGVPALGDRMDEGYRQHGAWAEPKLSMLPSELIFRQVYASFQHDRSAVPAVTAMGYRNVMWGDDYPHLEGTYGHTQDTLHELFDGVDDDVRRLITIDTFSELLGAPRPPHG